MITNAGQVQIAEWERKTIETPAGRVQIVVTYNDHTIQYYPVDESWRLDHPSRCIVIGRFPRTYIPLDQIRSFTVEPLEADGD